MIRNLMVGLTGASWLGQRMNAAVAIPNGAKLFPTDVPGGEWAEFLAAGFSKPVGGVIHTRETRPENGMPLGSIDTGYMSLETDGTLGNCTVFNSICPQRGPLNTAFFGMTVNDQVWLLARPTRQYHGLAQLMFQGVQTPNDIHYWGHYPVADLECDMPGSPVSVGLRAWSPFLPGDSRTSNTPGAVFEVHLRNLTKTSQWGKLIMNFPGPTQAEAQITNHSLRKRVVETPPDPQWIAEAPKITRAIRQQVRGEFSGLLVTSENVKGIGYAMGVAGDQEVQTGGPLSQMPFENSGVKWFATASTLPNPDEAEFGGSVSASFRLEPREEKTVRFVLAWFAPMWIGEGDHTFQHMYSTHYQSALEVAQFLSGEHDSVLRRILRWQEVIYGESTLPVWLRDSLINILHLFPINSLWAAARPPIGPWCRPEDGLFGLLDGIVEDPAIEPIADTFYANAPLVFFFPDLALSTLRGYKAYQFANGAAPWIFGGVVGTADGGYEETAGTEFAMPTPGYQTTTNGPAYVDMVDRYWQRSGNDDVLQEFFPSVKRNTTYTMNLRPEDGADGIISVPSGDVDPSRRGGTPGSLLEMVEVMKWFGMTPHVGGMHLAQLRMVQRMAEKAGDKGYIQQCQEWFEQGSQSMEKKMWAGRYYLAYNEPATSKKSDDIFAYQLDGQWMAEFHGLPGVFRPDRVKISLETIRQTCAALSPAGAANVAHPNGSLAQGRGYGPNAFFPPELFMLAMTYMYEGERHFGLELTLRCMHAISITSNSTWNQPNVIRGDTGERLFGSHYVQNMMLWAVPAALQGESIARFCAPGGLVDRIIQAATKSGDARA